MSQSLVSEQLLQTKAASYTLCVAILLSCQVSQVDGQGDSNRNGNASSPMLALLVIEGLWNVFWLCCLIHCCQRHYKLVSLKRQPDYGTCTAICCLFGCVWCVLCWPIDPWWWPFDGPDDVGIVVPDKFIVGGPVKVGNSAPWEQSASPHDDIRPAHAVEKTFSLATARRAHAQNKELADTIEMPTTVGSLPGGSLPNLIATH